MLRNINCSSVQSQSRLRKLVRIRVTTLRVRYCTMKQGSFLVSDRRASNVRIDGVMVMMYELRDTTGVDCD